MTLSFLFPSFLYLIPLLLIPFILHLISRTANKKILFAATRFLNIGKVPTTEKRKLKDFLLLLIRTLLILALIIYFANPILKQKNKNTDDTKKIIIIDTSLCSHHRDYKEKLGIALKEKINQEPEISIIWSNGTKIHHQQFKNISNLKDFIKIQSYNKPDLYEALLKAKNLIGSHQGEVHIFGWNDIRAYQQVRKPIFNLQTQIEFHQLVKLEDNISIQQVESHYLANEENLARISIHLQNNSNINQTIELEIVSEKNRKKDIVTIPARQNNFQHAINYKIKPGLPFVVRLNSDEFAIDDYFYSISPIEPKAELLLVLSEKPSLEAIYFEEAFTINDNQNTLINFSKTTSNMLDTKNLEDYSFFVLSECAHEVKQEQLSKIYQLVQKGATLICTPSNDYRKGYDQLSQAKLSSQIAIKLQKNEYAYLPFFINSLGNSKYFSIFESTGVAELLRIPFRKYIQLKSPNHIEQLLRLENGDSLLHVNSIGSGKSILFAFNLMTEWTDLPITVSFIPLFRHIINLDFEKNKRKTFSNHIIGEAIDINKSQSFVFKTFVEDNFLEITLDDLPPLIPGFYITKDQQKSFNISRDFSTINKLSPMEVKSRLISQENISNDTTYSTIDHSQITFQKYLIFFIFILLLIELNIYLISLKSLKRQLQL